MRNKVLTLRRAESDIQHITPWIAERSIQGAYAWLDSYEELMERLAQSAQTYPSAFEAAECKAPLRQALFGTRRGRRYRAIFVIAGDQVRVLRVRGPGQPPLQQDELW
jgi:plasmid stabilization system protein ParE